MAIPYSFVESRANGLTAPNLNTSIVQIINPDNHAILGPTFSLPSYPASLESKYPAGPTETFGFQFSLTDPPLKALSIANWPLGGAKIQPLFNDWFETLVPRFSSTWKSTGICYLLDISIQTMKPDIPLLKAAITHWSTKSGKFHFREGLMSPSIRDMDKLVGAPLIGDLPPYHFEKKYSGKTPFEIAVFNLTKIDLSYQTFIQKYHSPHLTLEQQHPYFLLCFLSRTFACTKSQTVIKEFATLAERLSQGKIFSLAPLLLAYLHNAIYELKGATGEVALGGPIWLLQFWLHAYFPSLGRDPSVFDEPD